MDPKDNDTAPAHAGRGVGACPLCNNEDIATIWNIREFDYEVSEHSVELKVRIPVRRCGACDFEYLDEEAERLKHIAVCDHLGVLPPDEIRRIRENHQMTRAAFAHLTGLGEASLNRWENGLSIQPHANDRYLRLLASPENIARLQDVAAPTRFQSAKTTEAPSKRVAGASRTLFDTYIVVDWSARSRPSSKNPEKNSIWWAVARTDGNRTPAAEPECKYNRTRREARCDLASMISKELDDGRRVLVGFDFPFGYPGGVAERLTGKASALALWDWLDKRIEDKSNNKNNRFEVASKINEKYPGVGPCWGRPGSWNFRNIPTRKSERTEQGHPPPEEYRITDKQADAKSVWQLFGAGSVGSQVLLGLPSLKRLIKHSDIAERATVWPFETGLKVPDVTQGHAVFVEVYPSLLRKEIKERSCPEEIPDRAQVRITAQAFAALDADGGLAPLFQGPSDPPLDPDKRQLVETEEGWIFGLGHEKALKNSLEYMLSAP